MSFKLKELDECGHETFYDFGRCLYKSTACGPWVVAVLPDRTEAYYESTEGNKLSMGTEVAYVKVGSIVEGSDVEVGPYDVMDPKEFWSVVKSVDEECDFYWRRDNLDHFNLLRNGAPIGGIVCGWGEFELELDRKRISKKDREALKKFCIDGDYCTPSTDIEGAVSAPKHGDIIKVPSTHLEIEFYEADYVF